jgi:ATP-dependent Lon protease
MVRCDKRCNIKQRNVLSKKKHSNSDDDNDTNKSSSDSESDNDGLDIHEFRKYIQKIFPSKHLQDKINRGKKVKQLIARDKKTEEEDDEDEWETDTGSSCSESECGKKQKQKQKKLNVSEDEEEDEKVVKQKQPINIIFTINDKYADDDDYDDDYSSENEDESSENEDEEVSSDESSECEEEEDDEDDEDEDYEEDEEEDDDEEESEDSNHRRKRTLYENDTLIQLKELLSKNPTDKSIKKCVASYEANLRRQAIRLERKNKKQTEKNVRIFKKVMRDKHINSDFAYYAKLPLEKQKSVIKEMREINNFTRIDKPYSMTLLDSPIPILYKTIAFKKINTLRYMNPDGGEYYKIKNWVDTFMKIPFGRYLELPINIDCGLEQCHEFMKHSQQTLDQAVFGLNDAKMQIMQMLGQLITNPKSIGTAIAIHGPPGTGKTSLVKEGISKILNRPFSFIALGGATDSSFLEGHGYTYEGSMWGKIVQILIDSKCMNPVIYFDELDKISETPRGEEIAGILTHLTDTTQNSQFHDKYFSEIDFDLSRCLFIFSYNDESKINPILKDRMYRIKTKGYSNKEKTNIANNYLLPKIREQVKFNQGDIIINDDVISYINEHHCNKEDGVRNMKRCLEIIYTKLNLYRLMKPGATLFDGEMSLKIEFPFVVTKDVIDKLIKKESDGLETWRALYL